VKKILIVVGTRPNFIKITQFRKALAAYPVMEMDIVHTGQHYDSKMADVFFDQFGLRPDHFLNVPAGTANFQVATIMLRLEEKILELSPSLIIVVGDVNSTLAASLTTNKMGIPLAHLESGLRSFDRSMPEEFNRILTDNLSDYFFVTEQSGYDVLRSQGIEESRLFFVGNTMIDTLVAFRKEIDASPVLANYSLHPKEYVLMTMHRPATVDTKEGLVQLLALIRQVTEKYTLVFPIHPRTLKNIQSFGLQADFVANSKLLLTEPLDYFAFQHLISHASFILTDSGGIQEESTFLQVPCLTLRSNTERPVTVTLGTNELVPFDLEVIGAKIKSIEGGTYKTGQIPPMWDGKATERIVLALNRILS
jgi:UDP-N-acetylglucosamine 2-epimerase (non-hydrolysing)